MSAVVHVNCLVSGDQNDATYYNKDTWTQSHGDYILNTVSVFVCTMYTCIHGISGPSHAQAMLFACFQPLTTVIIYYIDSAFIQIIFKHIEV